MKLPASPTFYTKALSRGISLYGVGVPDRQPLRPVPALSRW